MRSYMGCLLERSISPGYALPWSSFVDGHGFLYADTLAGLKQLVKHTLKK